MRVAYMQAKARYVNFLQLPYGFIAVGVWERITIDGFWVLLKDHYPRRTLLVAEEHFLLTR